MLQHQDVRWIKSVTRDKGASWAYMEFDVGDIFPLSFSKNPKWYPTNYEKAKPGELLVLFQTLLPTPDLIKGWYVTHLVTPVDNILFKDNSNETHPYKRRVLVIGKPDSAYRVNDNLWSFFKCNRGQICDIKTIERRFPPDFTISQKQSYIWNLFENKLSQPDIPIDFISSPFIDADEEFIEGAERTALRMHKYYERDPKAIRNAKALAKKENRFVCEVCSFDFSNVYPRLGDGFIECHHDVHISTGIVRKTTIKQLSLVCSNCHRMLHRKFEGCYLTVAELKQKFFE